MKLFTKLAAVHLLCLSALPVTAQVSDPAAQQTSDNTKDLVQYLKNLAAYMGYDVANPPETPPTTTSTQLLDAKGTGLFETSLYSTFFGAIPITDVTQSPANTFLFLPSGGGNDVFNAAANLTFTMQNYKTPSTGSNVNTVTVSPLLDQKPYQNDPVSQAVLNILGTPDVSYCTNSKTGVVTNPTDPNGLGGTGATNTNCPIAPAMFQAQVIENVLGKIPSTVDFFNFSSDASSAQAQVLPQLNSNSLIAPLYFDTQTSSSTGSSSSQSNNTGGLMAQSQAQQAANFIRYVSGSVIPTTLPSQTAYSSLYSQMQTGTPAQQASAEASLSAYLLNLRVYAAQSSVGIGNLYYILSRRLPQQQQSSDDSSGPSTPMSQALNEYNMATWRIYQPNSTTGQQSAQWIDKINTASPAAVEKEIAILLSEINYQLYLSRQIQERLLMTSSVSLLQGTKASQPSADLSNQVVAAPSNVTTSDSQSQ